MKVRNSVLKDRLDSLARLHRELDADIHDELVRPRPDMAHLQKLKRMRLRVKDRISVVESSYPPSRESRFRSAA